MSDHLISQELYEAAGDAWVAARARLDRANAEHDAAQQALNEAETNLAAQEVYPGVAAYAHARIPAERCRLGYSCRIHPQDDDDGGPF